MFQRCSLPCGPCSELSFDVLDVRTGAKVASIQKQVPSLWTWMFASDVDNYKIQFGMIQDPAWKALLLSFTIYMDFLFFNTPNLNNEEVGQDVAAAVAADVFMDSSTTGCFGGSSNSCCCCCCC
ncbi:Plscr1 [Symbiodinium sp. KB8]|nr:Plscr1 [Symbiodinium sp. KB8]